MLARLGNRVLAAGVVTALLLGIGALACGVALSLSALWETLG